MTISLLRRLNLYCRTYTIRTQRSINRLCMRVCISLTRGKHHLLRGDVRVSMYRLTPRTFHRSACTDEEMSGNAYVRQGYRFCMCFTIFLLDCGIVPTVLDFVCLFAGCKNTNGTCVYSGYKHNPTACIQQTCTKQGWTTNLYGNYQSNMFSSYITVTVGVPLVEQKMSAFPNYLDHFVSHLKIHILKEHILRNYERE